LKVQTPGNSDGSDVRSSMRKISRALKQDVVMLPGRCQVQGIQALCFNTPSASLEASKNIQAVQLIQASGLPYSTIVSTRLALF
jgi:hypothetical protein